MDLKRKGAIRYVAVERKVVRESFTAKLSR
jgi:hypothetical protein